MNFSRILFFVAAVLASGCESWRFDAQSEVFYVDEYGNKVSIEYAEGKEHQFDIPTGRGRYIKYSSKSRIRATLPDGRSFIAYKYMSPSGIEFRTKDEEWRVLTIHPNCFVYCRDDDGEYPMIYQGIMVGQSVKQVDKPDIDRKNSIKMMSHPRERPDSRGRTGDGERVAR